MAVSCFSTPYSNRSRGSKPVASRATIFCMSLRCMCQVKKQRDGGDVLHQVVRTLLLLSDSFGLQGRHSSISVAWWVFSCSPCRVLSPCRVVSTIPLCMIQCLGALLSKEWVHICPLLKRLLWDAEDTEQWGQ